MYQERPLRELRDRHPEGDEPNEPDEGTTMTRSHHISLDQMIDALEHGAALETDRREHLASCEQCRTLQAEMKNLLGSLSMVAGEPPTDELIRKAWLRIRAEAASQRSADLVEQAGRALKEIWATLTRDPLASPLAVRSVASSPRMLIYKAEGLVISLSVSEADDENVEIMGRVVPETTADVPEGRALLKVDGETREAALDFGAFRFKDVPGAKLELEVELGDILIHVPLPKSRAAE